MADNTVVNTGSGGDTIRDKDRSGVKTQIFGIDLGIGTGTENLMAGTMPTTTQKSATATQTGVAASASSVTILASNANRLGATVANDTTSASLYLRLSATAATTASGGYTVLLTAGAYYEVPFGYTGAIVGIWTAATGFANVSELT